MTSVICTLFEGDYHYGLAALTNSLYSQGYRGDVYAGYRGTLPPWASTAIENDCLSWAGSRTLNVAPGLQLHFLPLETEYHLTNYKPEFMLRLFSGPALNAGAIFYFDPDIVVKCNWNFYETWIMHGVGLVHEITSNDMPPTHPIRLEWNKVIVACELKLHRKLHSYINGGFCGVAKSNVEFLRIWAQIIREGVARFGLQPSKFMPCDRTHMFYASDQDALNIAAMCCSVPISEVGPDGMDFVYGGWIMSHAVGSSKPWKKRYLHSLLSGNAPSLAERLFWSNIDGPISPYKKMSIRIKRTSILIASFLGRFYRRY